MMIGGRFWGKLAVPAGLMGVGFCGAGAGTTGGRAPEGAPQKEEVPATGAPVPAALGVPPGGAGAAAEAAGTPARPAKMDPLAPATLMSGPSLYETGRIATASAPTQTGASPSDALIGANGQPMLAEGEVDSGRWPRRSTTGRWRRPSE